MSDNLRYTPCVRVVNTTTSDVKSLESTKSDGTGPTPIDLAYLAGLVDGEGWIGYLSTPSIQIDSVSPSLVTGPSVLFGGSVSTQDRKHSKVFRWRVHGPTAVGILKALLPYLRYKKRQAELVARMSRYPSKSAMHTAMQKRLKQSRERRY